MPLITLNGNLVTLDAKPHMIVFLKNQLIGWHLAGDTNTINILLVNNQFEIKVKNDQNFYEMNKVWNEALSLLTEIIRTSTP